MAFKKIFLLITLSILSISSIAQAQGVGPAPGNKIPHDLSLMATTGKIENLTSLSCDNGIALFFVRSLDWCPFCKTQAKDVNERASEFTDRGVNPVIISYDTPEIQENFHGQFGFTITSLSDVGSNVIKEFGVLNDATSPDSPVYGYPHPVVFLIGPDGTINSRLYIESETVPGGSNYRDRPEIDVILAEIDKM